jgi:hypothetical protein
VRGKGWRSLTEKGREVCGERLRCERVALTLYDDVQCQRGTRKCRMSGGTDWLILKRGY